MHVMACSRRIKQTAATIIALVTVSLLVVPLQQEKPGLELQQHLLQQLQLLQEQTHLSQQLQQHQQQQHIKKEQQQLKLCDCPREVMSVKDSNNNNINLNQTTCGNDAFQRGSGQKVVAFSFYGDPNSKFGKSRGYLDGIRENMELVEKFYPSWVMRLYFDLEPWDPIMTHLCSLACQSKILDLCHVGNLPGTPAVDARKIFPKIWRFFPTLDPQVDLFLSRDLDSRITEREVAAVQEWFKLGPSAIHVMRDHKWHGQSMLAGAWDADLTVGHGASRVSWYRSWINILGDKSSWVGRAKYGNDEQLLNRHVWPWAKEVILQHDSYQCLKFSVNTLGFPTERRKELNNFVGAPVKRNITNWDVCPPECRRNQHWEHC